MSWIHIDISQIKMCFCFIRYILPFVWRFEDHFRSPTIVIRAQSLTVASWVPEIHGEHSVSTRCALEMAQEILQIPAFAVPTIVALKTGPWVKTTSLTRFRPGPWNGL